jgi:hypothetical protein
VTASHSSRDAAALRGSAIVIALCVAVPLLVMGGTLLALAANTQRELGDQIMRENARAASTSGAEDALARLDDDPDFTGTYQFTIDGHTARVAVVPWADDHVDNDQNGTVDDAAEKPFLSIVSDGTVNVAYDHHGDEVVRPVRSYRSTTLAVVKKIDANLNVAQAVYIDDPLANFKLSGTSFLISGIDTNVDGTKGPQAARPGIGTPGLPAFILAQIAKNQKADVTGSGGTPSVVTVPVVNIKDVMTQFAPLATLVWNSASTSYGGNIGDRAKLLPVVAHAKGDLTLNGGTLGCGILIVDGDLVVHGGLDFAGIVIAGGSATFDGGGGKDVYGALMCLGALKGPDLTLNGSVRIRYSSQAIADVMTRLKGTVQLVSWLQK